jgi:hypothetical protein
VESLRKFKLDPSRGVKQNDEVIPPPTFSDKTIPVNWGYHQNSNIKVTTDQQTGETILTNQSRATKINTYYVPFDTPTVPTSPPSLPPPEPILQSLLTELRLALSERPIWTRRAIMNRIPRSNPGIYLLKPAIQYVAYQFRGGPWRDAIVRYGIDPRSSPEYRMYQTLFFKIVDNPEPPAPNASLDRKPWQDKRSEYTRKANPDTLDPNSHVFDGTSVSLDGKIWQVCDIADPLLVRLLSTPTLRSECDLHSDGWFCNGTWAKVRAIMRTKISAIRIGRELSEADFYQTLLLPDDVKDKARVTAYMPNLGFMASTVADDDGDDAASDVEDLVQGATGGFASMPGMSEKSWRRRKMKGVKRRNRKRLDGTSNMGFGKGRNLGAGGMLAKRGGKGLGAGSETISARESVGGGGSIGDEGSALSRSGSVRAHLAAVGIGTFDKAAQNKDQDEVFNGQSAVDDDDDSIEDDEGIGEDDEGEEDDGDEDEDEDENDEELDGEGW